jgi:endo-1,4-beta-mannosidase
MLNSNKFLLGANYWPRQKAMYWWKRFDAGEVREEFALAREIGLDIIRIFLMWEDFQPQPDQVSERALRDLETVCDIAHACGLGLDVTFFTGHMSGPNWAPAWMLAGDPAPGARPLVVNERVVHEGYLNPYEHPTVLGAARLLVETVVERLSDHPGIALWNLGNEPDLFAQPSSEASGRAWAREMSDLVRQHSKRAPVTCGLHVPNLGEHTGLRVDHVSGAMDCAAIHGYPMYVSWLDDPLDSNFVPFICALSAGLSGKPVLMEEFGGCTEAPGKPSSVWHWQRYGEPASQFMAGEEAFAEYIGKVLPKLVEVGSMGAILWCFADYHASLWTTPPCDQFHHERFFGLVRPDGSLKPHARVVQEFAKTAPQRRAQAPSWFPQLDAEAYYRDPGKHIRACYEQFVAQFPLAKI